MKGRSFSQSLLSEEKFADGKEIPENKNFSSANIANLLRVEEAKDTLVVQRKSKAKKYAGLTFETGQKCLMSCDIGFFNKDPDINYSFGFMYGSCQALDHPKYTRAYEVAGLHAMTPVCAGFICDLLCCPVLLLCTGGACVVGGTFDCAYHIKQCCTQSVRQEKNPVIHLSSSKHTLHGSAATISSSGPVISSETSTSELPNRQVML